MINNRQNGRRRGRGGGPRPSGPGNVDRGNRIDNRARGNASQLYEKYKTLARDMQTQGDRVMTEYYLQFADHYFRVLNENRARFEEQRPRRDDYQARGEQSDGDFQDDFDGEGEAAPHVAPAGGRSEQQAEGAGASAEQDWEPGSANGHDRGDDDGNRRRGRRGRPRRDDDFVAEAVDERIEADRLPPALALPLDAPDAEEAPKPKRRGRPPKAAQVEA